MDFGLVLRRPIETAALYGHVSNTYLSWAVQLRSEKTKAYQY